MITWINHHCSIFWIPLLVFSLLLIPGCGNPDTGNSPPENAGTPVAAIELVRRDLSRQLSTSATVQARQSIRLAARIAGTFEEVLVEEGDFVEQGYLLARLDVSEQRAELQAARAREERAQQEYRRAKELLDRDLISEAEYALENTNQRVAESERKLWETRVSFGQVKAPVSGVITARYVEPGEAVDARGTLFELAATDELILRFGVSELDVIHLETDQSVPLHIDALPGEEFSGSIRRIFPAADRDSRLITVEVSLPPETHQKGVRPGYLGRTRMAIDRRPDVIAVPASAIGEGENGSYVFVIAEERLHRREVSRGVTRGQWTEITSGLEEGEIILASNPIDMSDGQRVRIVGWRG